MELVFRELRSHVPVPGDLVLRPADPAQQERRDLAAFVRAEGVDGLVRGVGETRRLVVSGNPTLDDLLAAAFAERLLAGRALPAAAEGFARYAALQREGLHPGEVPLAESLEGVFLAQRNAHGEKLEDPAVGARFAADWRRTAEVLLAAAERGADAFKSALFGGPEFARERAFLAKDREVYRQDVLRGDRWIVRLPGGPPKASALILREPRSLLAKQWARHDEEAPIGGAYLLLGVRWGPGQWVFSTDPVQRLPILPLAQALQAAEAKADRLRSPADPWFDGAPFGHTLVGSPRGGTRLADAVVLGVVRAWTRGRRAPTQGRRRLTLALAALGGAAALAALYLTVLRGDPAAGASVDFRSRGAVLSPDSRAAIVRGAPRVRGFALLVAVGRPQRRTSRPVLGAAGDVARVYKLLRDRFGYAPEDMFVLSDQPETVREVAGEEIPVRPGLPDKRQVQAAMEELSGRTLTLEEGEQAQLVFYFAGHGQPPQPGERAGYLVLSGFGDVAEPLDRRGYDMGDLASHLRTKIAACRHQLLLLDCCHSGFAIRSYGDYRSEPYAVYDLWRNAAYAVLTAGTEEEKIEDGLQSAFNFALLEALGGGSTPTLVADGFVKGQAEVPADRRDGIVTDAELGTYLEMRVPQYCKDQAFAFIQSPRYVRGMERDDVGQFLFVPRAAR